MFGENLKKWRLAHHLNQVQLGRILSVKKQTISNWEKSSSIPSVDTLIRIAEKLHVTTDYLLGLDDREFIEVSGLTQEEVASYQDIINRYVDVKSQLKEKVK